jgi:hypothetical protein
MNNAYRVAGPELAEAIEMANLIDCDGHGHPETVAQSMIQLIPELNQHQEDIIGVSFSLVVSSILYGDLPEERVAFIISSTSAFNEDDMEKVLEHYARNYWARHDDPDGAEGVAIARRLLEQGKVVQPRLSGFRVHACTRGAWFNKAHGYGNTEL